MVQSSSDNDDKVMQFQAVTGLQDASLCAEILQAYDWDLDLAVRSMADGTMKEHAAFAAYEDSAYNQADSTDTVGASSVGMDDMHIGESRFVNSNGNYIDADHRNVLVRGQGSPGFIWRVATLPFSVIRGSYNLMYGAFGLGTSIAGGLLTHSLGALGWSGQNGERREEGAPLLPTSIGAAEAMSFLRSFEREYGDHHPAFLTTGFMDAIRRAREEFKFLFVYLHSPEHENTPLFCEKTLCSELVVQFVNENFVVWGGNIRSSEGFQMSNTLKASTFPFCAVIMAPAKQRVALLQQLEGPMSSADLFSALQKILEEQGVTLAAAKIEEEERQLNRRLREEQDAAYQAALHADQERERQRREEAERLAWEEVERERKLVEERLAAEQVAKEALERDAMLKRRRQEKAMTLGQEPEKGPNVTEVLVRFPKGERKGRRFHCTAPISSIYDFVDSLSDFDANKYKLVSNFPRVVYSADKFATSLRDAGLHPRASLYIQTEEEV